MLDINHIIENEALNRSDPEGNMFGLEHWSPMIAKQLARSEGIEELTEAHWHVVYALRNFYRDYGTTMTGRKMMESLEQDFADEGGRRYLYELFPKGPINQGSRIAGVPVPLNINDPSFGWAG